MSRTLIESYRENSRRVNNDKPFFIFGNPLFFLRNFKGNISIVGFLQQIFIFWRWDTTIVIYSNG